MSVALSLSHCEKKNESSGAPASGAKVEAVTETPAALQARVKGIFAPLPEQMLSAKYPLSAAKVELGHMLYFDTRLSRGQELSCASCHDLNGYGADTRPEAVERGRSFGHRKQFGERNSPSTYNAALQVAQFWDGRAADVEEQAKGPILNPVEMTMANPESVVAVLESIPGYAPLFAAAFPDVKPAISYDTMAQAIGAYERTLVTPSRFDAFLKGDVNALGPKEQAGLRAFVDSGCIACHQGVGVGGGMFQKLGLMKPYPTKDLGRSAVTHNDADAYFFKVPSLRNVAKTAPYFHDGSIKTLPEAVRVMGEYQTGKGVLPQDKVEDIVAFLESLTGELPTDKIAKPTLPPNGPRTPAGDPNFDPAAPPSTAGVPPKK